MSDKNRSFIKVYNSSFELDDKKLSPDELFVSAYLNRMRIYQDNVTVTNIEIIDKHIKCSFVNGNAAANKRWIKNILISLRTKGYIQFEFDGEFKNETLLIISFIDCGGHTQIDYNLFDSFDDQLKFYIYCYIDGFGEQGRVVSDEQFMQIIDYFTYDPECMMHAYRLAKSYSQNKIRSKIDEMDKEGVIYKLSGDYYYSENMKKKMQKSNVYYTRPSYDIIQLYDKFRQWKKKSKRVKIFDKIRYSINYGELDDEYIDELIELSSWGKKHKDGEYEGSWRKISYDDYEIYRLCRDFGIKDDFVDGCNRIIGSLIKIYSVKIEIDGFEKKYLAERDEINNPDIAAT